METKYPRQLTVIERPALTFEPKTGRPIFEQGYYFLPDMLAIAYPQCVTVWGWKKPCRDEIFGVPCLKADMEIQAVARLAIMSASHTIYQWDYEWDGEYTLN